MSPEELAKHRQEYWEALSSGLDNCRYGLPFTEEEKREVFSHILVVMSHYPSRCNNLLFFLFWLAFSFHFFDFGLQNSFNFDFLAEKLAYLKKKV